MAAEIRVDRITSRTGINTISFTGDGFSYLTNLGVGTTQPTSKLHIVGDTLITGVSTFNGDSNFSGNVTIGGTITYQDVKHIDAVGIITAQQGIQVLANGLNITGVSTFNDNINLGDSDKLLLGTGEDLEIYHDGSNSYVNDVGTGALRLQGSQVQIKGSNSENCAIFKTDQEVELYYDNSLKLETTSTGIVVTGTVGGDQLNISGVSTFAGNVYLGDSDVLNFGASQDLQIYHDGSDSYIKDAGTGALVLQGTNWYAQTAGGATYIQAIAGGAASLFHNGNAKLATTSSGIDVTGTVEANRLTAADTGGPQVVLKDSDSSGNAAVTYLEGQDSTGAQRFFIGDTDGTGNLKIQNQRSASIHLGTNADVKVVINSNGHLHPNADSTYDLGLTGTRWANVYADTLYGDGSNLTGIAAGGSGTFDTGISTSVIVPVTAGIGTNDTENRDVFTGPGIAYSFPSTASTQYVIESIHVVNKSGGNLYVSGRHDVNGGSNVPIANRVVVPYNGAVELLEQPHVANLSDVIRLQALTGTGSSATGANNGLDAFITYSTKSDSTDYIGVAQTITSTDQEFFEVASNPCVLQSLNLVNYSNNVDVDVSVSVFSGGTTGGIATTGIRRGYLAYNLTVPRNSTIELFDKPKRLESNQALLITASSNNQVGVVLSGKYITS